MEILGLIFVLSLPSIYFSPWFVSLFRGHTQIVPIFILNLFLGWTLIGWVIALVWAFANEGKHDRL